MNLSDAEMQRYLKHLQLPEVGVEGQLKLKRASVLVVGAGGLGSPVLLYLAAAGVGKIGIVDADVVNLSNLQRQVIHSTADCGLKKIKSAGQRISELNPELKIATYGQAYSDGDAIKLTSGYQFVVDCTDNLETRLLINETCVRLGIPFVYGVVYHYEGQVSVFDARRGPCFRCMYPVLPAKESIPDPAITGLLSTIPGTIGTLEANEVLKLILGIGQPLIGKLLLYDGLTTEIKKVKINKNPNCPVCGRKGTDTIKDK